MDKYTVKLMRKMTFWCRLNNILAPVAWGSLKTELRVRSFMAKNNYECHIENMEKAYRRKRTEVLMAARMSLRAQG